MTATEKTRLLPKDIHKSYVIPIPQEDLNNNTASESVCAYDSYALTKAELAAYIDDPFWVRVRCICFSMYWLLCAVALFVSCYIAVSALEGGFCVPAAGPINGDNASSAAAASISSTTSATNLVTTTLVSGTASDGSGGVIFRLLDQPSS